ncbi:acetyltransferase [Roseateles sp. DB2]|uniref:acetyltransferase n=1 Tax=Roseateles sp. DB2 TaxID=3453717 RepID=UPI003EEA07AC
MRTELPSPRNPALARALLVGAGGQGQVVADALQAAGPAWTLCFVDDREALWGQSLIGLPVLGSLRAVLQADDHVHVAIGSNVVRRRLFAGLDRKRMLTVQHPRAMVSSHARVGLGCFVAAGAVLGPSAVLGEGVILNHGAVVDHDCVLDDFCHVAPLASLAGDVRLGAGVLVGAGARLLPGVRVGAGAVIGAGAVVLNDVAPGATVVGVPAREMNSLSSKG